MEQERINEILEKSGVLLHGHFLLTSGKHSDKYMQCARLFQYPNFSEEVAKDLIEKFKDKKIDFVIGPAIGGIIFAYEVARQLGVLAIFSERENGDMKLRRGFEVYAGANVLVVEDVITTGGSVREVIELMKSLGANIVGVGCVVNRSGGKVQFDCPFESVISMDINTYEEDECPMCKQGTKPYKPGSRK